MQMKKNKKLISQKIPRIGLLQEAKLISIERKFCFHSKYSEKIVKYKKCKKKKKIFFKHSTEIDFWKTNI